MENVVNWNAVILGKVAPWNGILTSSDILFFKAKLNIYIKKHNSSGPLINRLNYFRNRFRFRQDVLSERLFFKFRISRRYRNMFVTGPDGFESSKIWIQVLLTHNLQWSFDMILYDPKIQCCMFVSRSHFLLPELSLY